MTASFDFAQDAFAIMKSSNTKRNVLYLIAFALYVMASVLIFATSIFKTSYWGGLFFAVIYFCVGAFLGSGFQYANKSTKKFSRVMFATFIGYGLLKIGEDYFGRLSESHTYLVLATLGPAIIGCALGTSITEKLCHN